MENLLNSIEFQSKHNRMVEKVQRIRSIAESRHGIKSDLQGCCIEYNSLLLKEIKKLGYVCEIIEGWCQYDYCEGCTDRSYDAHTWVDVHLENETLYIDITGDQFDWGLLDENKFNGAYIGGIPEFMSYEEPVNQLVEE